jgi:peptide/nickel transport system substrate-binding protein
VNLKKNISWHDGGAFTAFDVERAYTGILNIGAGCVYYNNIKNISTIISLSDYTIVFNLKQPQTNFINLLEIPIARDSYNGYIPVGTGPYVYASRENKSIHLTANENYRDGAPLIPQIEVRLMPDVDTSFFSFEAKAIDVVTTNMLNWSRYTSNLDSKIMKYPSGSFNFLYINQDNEFLSNAQIRQAIAHSINKKRINTEVLLSHGAVTDTIFSPNWWMYNGAAALYPYDPKSAIEKIGAALPERKEKISLRLLVNEGNDIKFNTAGIIKDCLEEVGLEVVPEFVTWETFVTRVEARDYDLYLGEMNYSAEVNPWYLLWDLENCQSLLADLQRQVTDNSRKKVYYELQRVTAENIPLIPLYFDVEALFCSNRIGGDIRPLRGNAFYGVSKWTLE